MLGILTVLLPLLGALLAGTIGRRLGSAVAIFATVGPMLLATLLSLVLYATLPEEPRREILFTWISSGDFVLSWGVLLDRLTVVMFCVVCMVSSAVHVYSIGYMRSDPSIARFMSYLSLFTFFMLALVSADNFIQLFFGWEGVGLASYLLIGFWHERRSANLAASKAFIVNRIGDVGLALGIAGVFALFGTVEYSVVLAEAGQVADVSWSAFGREWHALTVICLLFFVGAMGKSAQLGLHTWLPDAMEGPTPVSALIHAATMVTAGVFLICRLSPLYELAPFALSVVVLVGAATAFFAATVALVQNDIKRIIAYSTCSQLGYMFFAAGLSAYGVAMFHLGTHAFFKALLFLGAGSVITALHHEQDIRRMGSLSRRLPWSCAALWTGSLALVGFGIPVVGIGLAGFHSKDAVLEAAWAAHSPVATVALVLGLAAAVMTAFYSFRLLFLVFHLPQDADAAARAHAEAVEALADEPARAHEPDEHGLHGDEQARESPLTMMLPLAFLALGAIFSGFLLQETFIGEESGHFWGRALSLANDPLAAAHGNIPLWVKVAPLAAGLLGLLISLWLFFQSPGMRGALRARFDRLYRFLLCKWYFDELYERLFVRSTWGLGNGFFRYGDQGTIDRFGPDGTSALASRLGVRLRLMQTGYLYHYALLMLLGLVGLMGLMAFWIWRGGA